MMSLASAPSAPFSPAMSIGISGLCWIMFIGIPDHQTATTIPVHLFGWKDSALCPGLFKSESQLIPSRTFRTPAGNLRGINTFPEMVKGITKVELMKEGMPSAECRE
jgi:hypothetical protein